MDDPSAIDRTSARLQGLFAGAPGENGRDNAFRKRRSGQVRLKPEDLEFDIDFAGPDAGKGWRARALVAVLFTVLTLLLGLGAGNPGAAAGLLPLPYEAIPSLLGLAAIGAAVGAFIFFMSAVRRAASANAPRSSRLARRPVFVGTGSYGVQIGEDGLALSSTQRRFTAYWSTFDAATLYARDMNGARLPFITKAEAGGATLDAVLGPAGDNAALQAVVEGAAAWARTHSAIYLPLKLDPAFAVRLKKSGAERLVPAAQEREYLRLSRRLFEEGDGDLSVAGFRCGRSADDLAR